MRNVEMFELLERRSFFHFTQNNNNNNNNNNNKTKKSNFKIFQSFLLISSPRIVFIFKLFSGNFFS